MAKHPAGAHAHSTQVVQPPVVPEAFWPDGSPVSNWSKATQTMPGKRESAAADTTFSPARIAA